MKEVKAERSGNVGWVVWLSLWVMGWWASQCSAKERQTTTPTNQRKGTQCCSAALLFLEWMNNEWKKGRKRREQHKWSPKLLRSAVSEWNQLQSIAGPHCAAIDGIDFICFYGWPPGPFNFFNSQRELLPCSSTIQWKIFNWIDWWSCGKTKQTISSSPRAFIQENAEKRDWFCLLELNEWLPQAITKSKGIELIYEWNE